jgi:mannan endo-1,4-beta-mannosidase
MNTIMNLFFGYAFFLVTIITNCKEPIKGINEGPIDKDATPETKALYLNLKKMMGQHILFGHQDDLAYGVGRNDPVNGFCDVKDVCGSYPAIYGWDLGNILDSVNIDTVSFIKIKRLIKEGYSRGGIITISWHERNPIGVKVGDLTPVVKRLLPGADLNYKLTNLLDHVGKFISDLKDDKGKPIPVIFRPYHEHNGDWFWWGTKACTGHDFAALYRFTVEYLRDSLQIHQLLYAISPDRSRMNPMNFDKDMLYGYPGDDYIDIFGFDNYWDVGICFKSNARQHLYFQSSFLS